MQLHKVFDHMCSEQAVRKEALVKMQASEAKISFKIFFAILALKLSFQMLYTYCSRFEIFNRIISGWEVGILHYVRFLLDFFTLKFQKKALSNSKWRKNQDSQQPITIFCVKYLKHFFSWENFEKLIRKKSGRNIYSYDTVSLAI